MAAGTIVLTNNSTAVSGTGTAFTSELAVNGFIVANVGGTAYTLGIKSVESDTALTLTQAYRGPTGEGTAFDYVPAASLNLITSALMAQVSYAIRGLNLDKANWQQIFSDAESVTVTLPDGSSASGPSWGKMSGTFSSIDTALAAKASGGANDDITSLSGLTTALSIEQGGTGESTAEAARVALGVAYGTAEGTVAQGNDTRLGTLDGKTGGTVSSGITINAPGWALDNPATAFDISSGADGTNRIFRAYFTDNRWSVQSDFYRNSGINSYRLYTYDPDNGTKVWEFRTDGTLRSAGAVYANGTALTSDRRLKSDFKPVSIDLGDIDKLPVQTYTKVSPDDGGVSVHEIGLVAQDIEDVIPEIVTAFNWNDEYPDLRMVNYSGLTAWLVGYCKLLKDELQEQKQTLSDQNAVIQELQKRLKVLDGLDA